MRNPSMEAFLQEKGLTFEYVPSILVSSIVIDDEAHRQIRLEASVDDDHLELYRLALQDGVDMPAPVVFKDEHGKHPILDGIHRVTAMRAVGKTKTDAYVVQVPGLDEVEDVRRTVNLINGKPLSKEERIQQALHMVRSANWTAVEAGRRYGISDSILSLKMRADRGRDRIIQATNLTANRVELLMSQTALALAEAVAREDVLAGIVSVIDRLKKQRAPIDGKFVENMVREGRRIATDMNAKAFLEKLARDYPERKQAPDGHLVEERAVVYRARIQKQKFMTYVDKNLVNATLNNAERRQIVSLLRNAAQELTERVVKIGNKAKDAGADPAGARGRRRRGQAGRADSAALS